MIGHSRERYRAFGWAAARFDDLAQPGAGAAQRAAAGAAALFAAARRPAARCAIMLRDARKHRSPNAGWPEAAMAGALGLALAGPRHYAEGRSTIRGSATARARATPSRHRPRAARLHALPAC